MKSVVDQLSQKEKEALVHWFGTDSWYAFRKLIDIERLELAKDHVGQKDILQVRNLSGQSDSLKRLVGTIADLYKKSDKKKK